MGIHSSVCVISSAAHLTRALINNLWGQVSRCRATREVLVKLVSSTLRPHSEGFRTVPVLALNQYLKWCTQLRDLLLISITLLWLSVVLCPKLLLIYLNLKSFHFELYNSENKFKDSLRPLTYDCAVKSLKRWQISCLLIETII